jgi:type II pantothenate kinase
MFDWGSVSLLSLLKDSKLTFENAVKKIRRPDFFDNSRQFKQRLENNPYPRKMMIFVDNSGADIILGVLPFARHFLKNGTHVIIAANSHPSINDITADELTMLFGQVKDEIIEKAIKEGRLVSMGTGSSSPCLDFNKIDVKLAEEARSTDFIVIEGMGRAIHTNFYAKFTCEALKIAVIKNQTVAEMLGGALYDCVCLYSSGE